MTLAAYAHRVPSRPKAYYNSRATPSERDSASSAFAPARVGCASPGRAARRTQQPPPAGFTNRPFRLPRPSANLQFRCFARHGRRPYRESSVLRARRRALVPSVARCCVAIRVARSTSPCRGARAPCAVSRDFGSEALRFGDGLCSPASRCTTRTGGRARHERCTCPCRRPSNQTRARKRSSACTMCARQYRTLFGEAFGSSCCNFRTTCCRRRALLLSGLKRAWPATGRWQACRLRCAGRTSSRGGGLFLRFGLITALSGHVPLLSAPFCSSTALWPPSRRESSSE